MRAEGRGKGYIYLIRSPSGKGYVGQTMQRLNRRMNQHKHRCMCPRLAAAERKYGWEAMTITLLCTVAEEELDAAEERFIAELGTLHPAGYNLQRGGRSGQGMMHPETKAKIGSLKRAQWQAGVFDPGSGKGPHTEVVVARNTAALRANQEKRLAGLEGEALRLAQRQVRNDRRAHEKALAKRQASRDPAAWAAWQAAEAKLTIDQRKMLACANKRAERMAAMTSVDAAAFMQSCRANAVATARSRKADMPELERWYPNTLTAAEVRALRANGGVWPSSAPDPPASSAKATERASDAGGYETGSEA